MVDKRKWLKAINGSLESVTSSEESCAFSDSVVNDGKYAIPPVFNAPWDVVLSFASDKANLFAENFSTNSGVNQPK